MNKQPDKKPVTRPIPKPAPKEPVKKDDGTTLLGDGLAKSAAEAIKKNRRDRDKFLDSL